MRKQERIEEYHARAKTLMNKGKIHDHLALWEEAYREFPNETAVRSSMMFALFAVAIETDDWSRSSEIIELAESLLDKAQSYRDLAIQELCITYNALGDKEKVKNTQKWLRMESSQKRRSFAWH